MEWVAMPTGGFAGREMKPSHQIIAAMMEQRLLHRFGHPSSLTARRLKL